MPGIPHALGLNALMKQRVDYSATDKSEEEPNEQNESNGDQQGCEKNHDTLPTRWLRKIDKLLTKKQPPDW